MVNTAKSPEYRSWEAFLKASFGKWNIDPIHNGRGNNNLILFRRYAHGEGDEGSGVFIMIDTVNGSSTISAGKFEDGFGSVTDGVFITLWSQAMVRKDEAFRFVSWRTGTRI